MESSVFRYQPFKKSEKLFDFDRIWYVGTQNHESSERSGFPPEDKNSLSSFRPPGNKKNMINYQACHGKKINYKVIVARKY